LIGVRKRPDVRTFAWPIRRCDNDVTLTGTRNGRMNDAAPRWSRRRLFEMIGAAAGGAAAYRAMTRLGHAEEWNDK